MLGTIRKTTLFLILAIPALAFSQAGTFELDPQQSNVSFTLGDVLHTVHGTFRLKSGTVHFDNATGTASGLLILDAASGDSGSKGRDSRMHRDILESAKFPEITFAPHRITGQVPQEGSAQVQISGTMTLHGTPHDISITSPVTIHAGKVVADMTFVVPYVAWGLKNPSTFILRVSDKVEIAVHAVGRLTE